MKVAFLVPPPALRVGGLDAAIDGLRSALTAAGAEVRDGEPDARTELVHFHGLWQWRYHAIARRCRERGVPYVVSPHGMLEPWAWAHKAWKKRPYYHLFEKRFLRGAAALLATAKPEAERLRALLSGCRVETLPLGTPGTAAPDYTAPRAVLGWSPAERVLLFLSRIHKKKGLDLLLQALAQVKAPGPLRLVIVGDGEPAYVESLRTWAASHASELPRVDWIGPVWGEARWPYFQGADLFCLPTHSENFGLVVLEAWQTGTPVLTTPGTPWAADLPDRGYLCDPAAASIAAALSRFLTEPVATPQSRQTLHEWVVHNFSWPRLGPAYQALYEKLVRQAGEAGQQRLCRN